jgi:DNA-binding GntR family transcriptional regulator
VISRVRTVSTPLKARDEQLSDAAFQRLRADVLFGKLKPGEKVTEAQLGQRLGLGKAPVRNALARLVQEGLLEARPRSGFLIVPITMEDILECFQLRLLLEPMAARLAAGRLSSAQVRRLMQLANVKNTSGKTRPSIDDLQVLLEADREYHLTIAQASGNRRLHKVLTGLMEQLQRPLYLGLLRPGSYDRFQAGSDSMLAALVSNDGEGAAKIAYEHVYAGQQLVVETMLKNTKDVEQL